MKLISVNVGSPRKINWLGKEITTSIYKSSVSGLCKLTLLGIEGDTQSDRKHHGGVNKAVYSYDEEFYQHWKKQIEWNNWEPGLFGENLTTSGLTDDKVVIGNVYKIGTAKIQSTEPRFPCKNLNAKFGMKDMIEKFTQQNRFGTYYRVVEEGTICAGDEIELIEECSFKITTGDITECRFSKGKDQDLLKSILESPFVTDDIKEGLSVFKRS